MDGLKVKETAFKHHNVPFCYWGTGLRWIPHCNLDNLHIDLLSVH